MSDRTPPKDLLDWLGISDTPNWRVARPLGAMVAMIIGFLLIGAIIAAFAMLFATIKSAVMGGTVNLSAGALIVAILGAPFLVWGTVLKHKTVEFQKESHITDRISKAVEQLGAEKTVKKQLINSAGKKVFEKDASGNPDFAKPVLVEETLPNIEVRIGGLLSLERIAQNSTAYDKGRDHVRVMEILCAYVRENAPVTAAKSSLREDWEIASQDRHHSPGVSPSEFMESAGIDPSEPLDDHIGVIATKAWASNLPKPRADISMALQVLGRRDRDQTMIEARWGNNADPRGNWVFDQTNLSSQELWTSINDFKGFRLDPSHVNLQGADLKFLNLSGAKFNGSRLDGADIRKVKLIGSQWIGASTMCADLSDSDLSCGLMLQARFDGVTMRNTVSAVATPRLFSLTG